MTDYILSELKDGVLCLTMNRPKKKNALTVAMYTDLADGLEAAEANDDVRVVLITGVHDSFTAGNDLFDFIQQNAAGGEMRPVSRFLKAISTASKPIVAAVNGVAVGVGVTMLLHCDLVYSADTAAYSMPFVNLGVVPEAGSSYLLPQMVGQRRAAELLLLGDKFGADKAAEFGIVNQVVAADELETTAWSYAQKLVKQPPEALRLSKQLLKKGNQQAMLAAMKEEGQIFQERLQSAETLAIMQSFFSR